VSGLLVLGAIALAVLMWRRRAARRTAAATERIAGVVAPTGPRGRYPRPAKGRNAPPGRAELRAAVVCVLCGSGSGDPGEALVLLSWCSTCRADRQLTISTGDPS